MFVAQLHKKLNPPDEYKEDLLTSNVFGIWQYLPTEVVEAGLLRFLKTACTLQNVNFSGPDKINDPPHMEFWPWIQEGDAKGTEPDVLIEMTASDSRKWLVLVEAKYLSQKSSFANEDNEDKGRLPTDQLAKEMDNLRKIAQNGDFNDYALIYVTTHMSMPKKDIKEAIQELRDNGRMDDDEPDRFYWTTWRRLPDIMKEAMGICQDYHRKLLGDLHEIIFRMGLYFFTGEWKPIRMAKYSFEKSP